MCVCVCAGLVSYGNFFLFLSPLSNCTDSSHLRHGTKHVSFSNDKFSSLENCAATKTLDPEFIVYVYRANYYGNVVTLDRLNYESFVGIFERFFCHVQIYKLLSLITENGNDWSGKKKYWKFNFCQAFVFLSYYKINDNFLFRILNEDPQKYLSIDHISVINLKEILENYLPYICIKIV